MTALLTEEQIERIAERVFERLSVGEEWLSPRRAAEIADLSTEAIREAIRRSELPADYPLARRPRIKRSELQRWIERGAS